MARQIITTLIDDLDGTTADGTLEFSFDGATYTVDLSQDNEGKLREALAPYIAAGARVGRSSTTLRPGRSVSQRGSRMENQAIREWAEANGYELAERGRIPRTIVDAYNDRNAAPAAPVKATEEPAAKPARRARKAAAVPAADFQPAS